MTFQALFRRFHYKIFKYLPLFSKKPWEIIGVKEGKISQGRMKFARLLGILPDYPKKNSVETLRSPGGGPLHSRLVHSFNHSFKRTSSLCTLYSRYSRRNARFVESNGCTQAKRTSTIDRQKELGHSSQRLGRCSGHIPRV
jgi:hypothetical protein